MKGSIGSLHNHPAQVPDATEHNSLRSGALRLLAAVAGIGIGGAAIVSSADAEPGHHGHEPHVIAHKHKKHSDPVSPTGTQAATNSTLPNTVATLMYDNAVELNTASRQCSGWLIHNSSNKVIGMYTAAHCVEPQKGWFINSIGNDLVTNTPPKPLKVGIGNVDAQLTTAAKMESFVTGEPNTNSDMAIGVAPGYSIQQVLANADLAPLSLIESLAPGSTIYSSGWPAENPIQFTQRVKNGTETYAAYRRQEFSMTVAGIANMPMPGYDRQIRTLVTLVKTGKDDEICAPGASGSVAFIMQNGKPVILGTQSVYQNLDQPVPGITASPATIRAQIEQEFGISTEGYDGVCYFDVDSPLTNYQPPPPTIEEIIIHFGGSSPSDPGTPGTPGSGSPGAPGSPGGSPPPVEGSPPTLEQLAAQEFVDPSYQKLIVNGYVSIGSKEWVKNPVIFYDSSTGQTLVGYSSEAEDGNLMLASFASLGDLTFYNTLGSGQPSFKTSTGPDTFGLNSQDQLYGYTDSTGYTFGEEDDGSPLFGPGTATLTYNTQNGTFTLDQSGLSLL